MKMEILLIEEVAPAETDSGVTGSYSQINRF